MDDKIRDLQDRFRRLANDVGLDETDLHVISDGESPSKATDVKFCINVSGTLEQIEKLLNDAVSEEDVARLAAERHLCRPRQ